jgi:hypothetical protein
MLYDEIYGLREEIRKMNAFGCVKTHLKIENACYVRIHLMRQDTNEEMTNVSSSLIMQYFSA